VEEAAFSVAQARRVLEAGLAHGLRPKLHVDQLGAGGGAELAAELGAASADHLDRVTDAGIAALAAAGVPAVLLPGAVFTLGLPTYAPARRLLDAGVPVALSTDFNPGTCYCENVFLMGTIASNFMRMTVTEVLKGLTLNGARALGMEDTWAAWRWASAPICSCSTPPATSPSLPLGINRWRRSSRTALWSWNEARGAMKLVECVPNISEGATGTRWSVSSMRCAAPRG